MPWQTEWAMHGRLIGGSLGAAAAFVALHQAWGPASVARAGSMQLAAPAPIARAAQNDPPAGSAAPSLDGLDLKRMTRRDGIETAPVGTSIAKLTLDPDLQRTAVALMSEGHPPEAAVVLMEVETGRLIVYASHLEDGSSRDLCAEATAPSASVFKIVTAATLIEGAHLGPDTKQCYRGGEQRIVAADLVEDPRRDRWCTTLAGAMGRSINAVFARLAKEHLEPSALDAMARRFGYGEALPFDVPVQPSAVHVPDDALEFARTAAGFWNTTLSPLQAVEISAIVARAGEAVRPTIVEEVVSEAGAVVWSPPEARTSRRVVDSDTAEKLATMMQQGIKDGTSFHAFHDGRGAPFLPGLTVAGKTGTLTDGAAHRYYTWFTGFASSKPAPALRQVAVAVLVVNGPVWRVKANVLAREVLQAYFASRGAAGVSPPRGAVAARRNR